MDTARTLEEKRERVLEQMRAIRSMRPESVTEQYLKVTHKGKRKPVMRGPYWVYTRKEAGKTVGQRLRREDAEQVTKDIEAHRKFVALCKEFETLTNNRVSSRGVLSFHRVACPFYLLIRTQSWGRPCRRRICT